MSIILKMVIRTLEFEGDEIALYNITTSSYILYHYLRGYRARSKSMPYLQKNLNTPLIYIYIYIYIYIRVAGADLGIS